MMIGYILQLRRTYKMNPTQDEEAVNDILYLTEIIEKLEKELIEQNEIVKYLQRALEINYFQRKTHI